MANEGDGLTKYQRYYRRHKEERASKRNPEHDAKRESDLTASRQSEQAYRDANQEAIRAGRQRRAANKRDADRAYYEAKIKSNPERRAERNRASVMRGRLVRTGVSPEMYDRMLLQQSGLCSICGKDGGKKTLHADHDHDTGSVRKLLCHRCNTAIGLLYDDPGLLLSAHVYLVTAGRTTSHV